MKTKKTKTIMFTVKPGEFKADRHVMLASESLCLQPSCASLFFNSEDKSGVAVLYWNDVTTGLKALEMIKKYVESKDWIE
jgi:hypothetical protein